MKQELKLKLTEYEEFMKKFAFQGLILPTEHELAEKIILDQKKSIENKIEELKIVAKEHQSNFKDYYKSNMH